MHTRRGEFSTRPDEVNLPPFLKSLGAVEGSGFAEVLYPRLSRMGIPVNEKKAEGNK
jgi:hypothetical protein